MHGKFSIRDAVEKGANEKQKHRVGSPESGCHQGRRGTAGFWRGSPEHWARLRDRGRIRAKRRLCGHPPWAVALWTRTGVLKLESAPASSGRL